MADEKYVSYEGLQRYHELLSNKIRLEHSGLSEAIDNLNLTKASEQEVQAITAALSEKVDKETGKGLSTNDFTNVYKEKLDGLNISYNTTAYWNEHSDYFPERSEIVVYSDRYTYVDDQNVTHYIPGVKIGSGNAYVADLAFIDEELERQLIAHIQDTVIHVTAQDRNFWNNKLNVNDTQEVIDGDTLVFNRL